MNPTRFFRRLLFALLTFAFAGSAWAQVENIAKAIEDHYFDAAQGARIAADLRSAARSGAFDAYTDGRDLAAALTARLRPIDRHFRVVWQPADAPARAEPRRPPPPDDDGIARVEMRAGGIGYIELRAFAHFEFDDPQAPARRAIDAALQRVQAADAVIIDLRANGGGSPAMVGYLSSAFVTRGAAIHNTFRTRHETLSEAPAQWYARPMPDKPLYVLISRRTGSAAESFAYTLKNAKRAVVVGETSAGAANPGEFIDAGQGFRVFVATGSPVSPITRSNWEGVGVAPDIAVPAADALRTAETHARSRR